MSFWEHVEYLREIRNLTRKELSSKAGFSIASISTGIARGSYPSADIAVQIAQVLGVSVEYLVTGKEGSKESVLTPEIKKIVTLLSTLDSKEKEAFLTLLEAVAKKH